MLFLDTPKSALAHPHHPAAASHSGFYQRIGCGGDSFTKRVQHRVKSSVQVQEGISVLGSGVGALQCDHT
jgi:hypothetical protein